LTRSSGLQRSLLRIITITLRLSSRFRGLSLCLSLHAGRLSCSLGCSHGLRSRGLCTRSFCRKPCSSLGFSMLHLRDSVASLLRNTFCDLLLSRQCTCTLRTRLGQRCVMLTLRLCSRACGFFTQSCFDGGLTRSLLFGRSGLLSKQHSWCLAQLLQRGMHL